MRSVGEFERMTQGEISRYAPWHQPPSFPWLAVASAVVIAIVVLRWFL